MKSVASNAALLLSAALPSALAWGATGHETVAYVAQSYLSSDTVSWAQNILSDTSSDYLANIATWADTYRYTSAGKWSAPLHFIDAQDDPPHSCGVDFDRDCGEGGCVVSAITNYTQMVNDQDADQFTALKFLVHFLGDIHQPLHDEYLSVGGNDIDVNYGSTQTNLHAVWDTYMINSDAGTASIEHAKTFSTKLVKAINSGAYKSKKAGWLNGIDLSSQSSIQDSAMTFASDANSYVCTVVMPDGVDSVQGQDLSGDYTNGALPTVEELLSRAGYRLAAWLNLIVTGSTGM